VFLIASPISGIVTTRCENYVQLVVWWYLWREECCAWICVVEITVINVRTRVVVEIWNYCSKEPSRYLDTGIPLRALLRMVPTVRSFLVIFSLDLLELQICLAWAVTWSFCLVVIVWHDSMTSLCVCLFVRDMVSTAR
jgi:hypothetical protein